MRYKSMDNYYIYHIFKDAFFKGYSINNTSINSSLKYERGIQEEKMNQLFKQQSSIIKYLDFFSGNI
jgi:hypothetical protein